MAGQRIVNGVVATPTLEQVFQLQAEGRLDEAIELLASEADKPSEPVMRWYAAALRVHVLNLSGRASEAEAESAVARELEIALRGNDLVARTLRGEARVRLGDFQAAVADFHSVLDALGDWRFPTSYGGPPTNMTDLALTTEARTRALLGLSFAYTMSGRHDLAMSWASAAEQHMADLFYVAGHGLYGPIMGRLMPEAYLARGVNLAFLGAAHIVAGGEDKTVAAFFAAAQSYFDATGFSQGRVYAVALRAMAYLRAKRIDEAEREAGVAAGMARQAGLVDFVWRVRALEAEALLAGGRTGDAEVAFRDAQVAVDRITGIIGSDRDKRRFGIGKDDITYRLAQLAFVKGDPSLLFKDLERGRARAFVDMLATIPVAGGGSDFEVLDRKTAETSRLVSRAETAQAGGTTRALVVEDELEAIGRDRAVLVDRIRRVNPLLAETRGLGDPDLATVRADLKPDELLVYFLPARGADRLRALHATRDRAWLEQYPLSADELSSALKLLNGAITRNDRAGQEDIVERLSRGFDVSRWRGYALVHLVPSGWIYSVPWGITAIDVPVAVVPTGSWPSQVKVAPVRAANVVVVGDPDFAGRLTQLPGARTEALRVAGKYGATALIGAAASESAIRDAVGSGVDILHLATHGKFNTRDPLRSALYLKDGIPLDAARLFEAPLSAQLVILSACETGIGTAVAGDDFLGLPRSFYLGGTRTIVSSLWPVDDAGTLAFMEHFHKLAAEGDFAAAWIGARDALRRDGFPPWIYGAFVLGGAR